MTNGEKKSKQELIFFIRYMMTEIKKLNNMGMKEMTKKDKRKLIKYKQRDGYVNMKHNNKGDDNSNGREVKLNKENFWSK